jgi:hypothetical protein
MIICFNCYMNIHNSIYYAQDHAFCTNSCRTFFITNKYTNTIVNNYKHRHDTSGNIFINIKKTVYCKFRLLLYIIKYLLLYKIK